MIQMTHCYEKSLVPTSNLDTDVKGAVTEMIIKIIEEDPSQHADACASLESVFKDLGDFPNTIKVWLGLGIT